MILQGAFQESYAISRGTKCKQHLFSLSLNPPKNEDVSKKDFEKAISKTENRLGLQDQPRAIVFHEKYGDDGELRRHAHAVWCRIDAENMRAVQLSYSKNKLQEVSRELYIEHGWTMPRGHLNPELTDRRNFSLAEWQQAKRVGKDPKEEKVRFQNTWAVSDFRQALSNALQEQGYILAKEDRRGFVAVDHDGEVYSLSRWVGVKAKQVREKLGDAKELPNVEAAHEQAAKIVADRLQQIRIEQAEKHRKEQIAENERQEKAKQEQTKSQAQLINEQRERRTSEEEARQARFRTGFWGFWDRVTGTHKRTTEQNQREILEAKKRDDVETAKLRQQQLQQEQKRREAAAKERSEYIEQQRELRRDTQTLNRSPSRQMQHDGPAPER